MTLSFWLDVPNIWFAIVSVVTEGLDCHQHPANLAFHRLWDSFSFRRDCVVAYWVVPLLACTILSGKCSIVRWLDSYGSINIQFLYANWWVQITAFQQNLLLKTVLSLANSDVAFSIAVSEPSFCSICFADSLHNSKIPFVLCHLSAYNWLSSEKGLIKGQIVF